jgi:23S rRNA (uracil1939-C5)-methyltransferase
VLLTIDKLIYGGNGLARLPADDKGPGKAAFLPFVLEGERVEAAITEQKPGFAHARVEKIIEASPHRVQPACPYFGECGGCQYQHASYEHQLQIKSTILRETLRRVGKIEFVDEVHVHASPPWNYRNRTRMRLRSRPFLLGYNRFGSNEVMAIEQCPISSPLINGAIAILWELGRTDMVSADIREIELFANAEDTQLLVELTVEEKGWRRGRKSDLLRFVRSLRTAIPEITGIALFHAAGQGTPERADIPPELQETFGADHLRYSTSATQYQVSAGSFFQTNRFLTEKLVELVTEGRSGEYALDLYAGTGLFSVLLAQNFRNLAAVESGPLAFHDLKHNCPGNVTLYRATTEQFLAELQRRKRIDLIVVDPPRAGLGGKVVRLLAGGGAPRITYVSCDPATLARDVNVLTQSGYRIDEAHVIDLFPQTFHIESVVQLVR